MDANTHGRAEQVAGKSFKACRNKYRVQDRPLGEAHGVEHESQQSAGKAEVQKCQSLAGRKSVWKEGRSRNTTGTGATVRDEPTNKSLVFGSFYQWNTPQICADRNGKHSNTACRVSNSSLAGGNGKHFFVVCSIGGANHHNVPGGPEQTGNLCEGE